MATILAGGELFTWCQHGTPLGHPCQFCPTTSVAHLAPAQLVQYGWTCPSCGHSYAPWVPECHHCPVPPSPIAKGGDG